MKKTNFHGNSKKPEIDVNKPPEQKFWQKQGPFTIWYFIITLFLLYLFQSSMQVKKEQIPYSQFQDYLTTDQIAECVIREKLITGTLRLTDPKTGKPRRFVTVPLYNADLAKDLKGRVEILKIHTHELKLSPDVDLEIIARRTPGFVGADIANVANEAAILAARTDREAITTEDFEAAIDRVIAGPEKKSSTLSPEEKHRVAYHESGHTLIAELVPTGEPVHKVSIIPRGIGALGYTLQVPEKEKFLATKNELLDQVAILLGGRVAEEIVFGDISTGAQNDLERSSELARNMVCSYGMSEKLGALTFGKKHASLFLGTEYGEEKNYSEETARQIDSEVKAVVQDSYQRVSSLLKENRPVLDSLAAKLEEKEVLSGEEVKSIVKKP